MYFLQYNAIPLPNRMEPGESVGGAFVNCWIDRPTAVEAEIVAKQLIESAGWQVVETMEVYATSDADCGLGEDAKDRFEQALIDGEVLVFHVYPDEPSEDGDR